MTLLKRSTTTVLTLLAVITCPLSSALAQPESSIERRRRSIVVPPIRPLETSPELQRAQSLLSTADELTTDVRIESIESVAPMIAAYEQALDAYVILDELDVDESDRRFSTYSDTRLTIYEVLSDLHYISCQAPQAIAWIQEALQFIQQPGNVSTASFKITDRLDSYKRFSQRLGDLHLTNDSPDAALQAYTRGLDYGADWPQSAVRTPNYQQISNLLRSQLSLLPPATPAADGVERQLVAIWELAGATVEVRGLLAALYSLEREGIPPSQQLIDQVIGTSRRYGYQAGELEGLLLSGKVAIDTSDYDRAKDLGQQALDLAQQLNSNSDEIVALNLLAQAAWGNDNVQTAIFSYEAVLERLEQQPSSRFFNFSRVSQQDVVISLVALYRKTDQSAKAQALTSRYDSLLHAPPLIRIGRLRASPFANISFSNSLPFARLCDEALQPTIRVSRRFSRSRINQTPSLFRGVNIPSNLPMP